MIFLSPAGRVAFALHLGRWVSIEGLADGGHPRAALIVAGLKEGQLTAPVEVQITSATDEPLLHLRLTSPEHGALEILQSDESKCQNPDIFPVTTTITDGAGHLEEWEEVDPRRPARIN